MGTGASKGHPRERLVDVHPVVLLSVGRKAHDVVRRHHVGGFVPYATLVHLEQPEETVAAEDQLRGSKPLADAIEGLLQVANQVFSFETAA